MILGTGDLGDHRALHIATLSRQTVIENDAEHLGFDGYFLFEVSDIPGCKGITIIGKVCSVDTAFRLVDVWRSHKQLNMFEESTVP